MRKLEWALFPDDEEMDQVLPEWVKKEEQIINIETMPDGMIKVWYWDE